MTTEEHYREIVLQAALLKKDVRSSLEHLRKQAVELEQHIGRLRSQLDLLLTYVSD